MAKRIFAPLTLLGCAAHVSCRSTHNAESRYLDPLYDPGYEYRPYPVDAVEKSLQPNTGVNAVPLALDTSKPAVMIKLDDLDAGNFDQFEQVAEYLQGKRVHASFGVITQRMAGTGRSMISQRMCSWLLEKQNSGNFEIWNHGLMHLPGEQDEKDYIGQVNALNTSQSLLKSCGLNPSAYGAPYNAANNYTLAAIRTQPDIKLWFFPTPGTFTDEDLALNSPILLDPRRTRLDMELASSQISFDFFKANYATITKRNMATVYVLQGHPSRWDRESFQNFTQIVDFLAAEGHPFVNPTEYFLWQD